MSITTFAIHRKCKVQMARHEGKLLHQAVKRSNIKVTDFFSLLGVSRGTMYNYFDSEELTDDVKEKVALVLRRSVGDIFGQIGNNTQGNIITDNRGLIYVSIENSHEYARCCHDWNYVNTIDKVFIPNVAYKGDISRFFEVDGDRMLPDIAEGNIVVAQRTNMESWSGISDFQTYVVVTSEQVIICRLYRLDDRRFVMISDNKEVYPQVTILQAEIKELWLVKKRLDWRTIPVRTIEISSC